VIDPRKDDEEVNPFFYDKSLAESGRKKFKELGYQSDPFMPWVACCNDGSEFYSKASPEQRESFLSDG
jgi:hypothetical protein